MAPRFSILETIMGALADGFRCLPFCFRVGWPVIFLQVIMVLALEAGTVALPMETGLQVVLWQVIPVLILSFLYAPVYVACLQCVALNERGPEGWFAYRPGEKALAVALTSIVIKFVTILMGVLAIVPATLALAGAALGDLEGEVTIIAEELGPFGSMVEQWIERLREMAPLTDSGAAAGVLLLLCLLIFFWVVTRLSLSIPAAALERRYFPYIRSFELTRGRFWVLLVAHLGYFVCLGGVALFVGGAIALLSSLVAVAGTIGTSGGLGGIGLAGAALAIFWFWLLGSFASFHGRIWRGI